jgi:hypothetical protein
MVQAPLACRSNLSRSPQHHPAEVRVSELNAQGLAPKKSPALRFGTEDRASLDVLKMLAMCLARQRQTS